MSDTKQIWSETAPQYKKDGEMYCSIEYDENGDPRRIYVAQNQLRKGEFDVEGATAVYILHNVPTLPQADEEVKEYVEQLDFIDEVVMHADE